MEGTLEGPICREIGWERDMPCCTKQFHVLVMWWISLQILTIDTP